MKMVIRRFLWDDVDDCVIAETDDTGAALVTYTHEPGTFGPLLNENRGGAKSYYHFDALGSTTQLSNDMGDVTDTFQYGAWGNQVARSGTTPTPYTWVGRWGYQDGTDTTGGFYIRARTYQPTVARWMSVDPILKQYVYVYCSNNPIASVDASGFAPDVACCECEMAKAFAAEEGLTTIMRHDHRDKNITRQCSATISCKKDGCGGSTGCGLTDMTPKFSGKKGGVLQYTINVCVSCSCRPAMTVLTHELAHFDQACQFQGITDFNSFFSHEKQAATYHCLEAASGHPGFDIAHCILCSIWLSCLRKPFGPCVYNPDNLTPAPAPPACTCSEIGLQTAPGGVSCDPRRL